jgi:hypothetical protein
MDDIKRLHPSWELVPVGALAPGEWRVVPAVGSVRRSDQAMPTQCRMGSTGGSVTAMAAATSSVESDA